MSPFDDLEQPVGRYMANLPADVRKVEQWLGKWAGSVQRSAAASEQRFTEWLHQEIQRFQREVLQQQAPSGRVAPGDETARKLKMHPHLTQRQARTPSPIQPTPGTPLKLPPRTGFLPLSDQDYADAAKTLDCETRLIHAMAKKEGKDHGFDTFNHPVILFEPLHFAKLSNHAAAYRFKYPDLTHLQPKPHPYGSPSAQWDRLQRAYLLSPRAALEATSWGKFQILGQFHYLACFATVELFVTAMCASEQAHLRAFVSFILGKNLQQAFHTKDFAAIAKGYNGTGYRASNYDQKLEAIYDALPQ